MKYKYINSNDEIWKKILPLLPKDNNDKENEKLILINSVFYLQDYKRKNKDEYSLQLHWNRLENDINKILIGKGNIVKEIKKIDNDTLRRKFDDWRNKGVWEKLLPIFDESSTHCWITQEGMYEVFLICSSFIRNKNVEQIKNIRYQCKEEFKEKIQAIKHENIELKNTNKYLEKRLEIWKS